MRRPLGCTSTTGSAPDAALHDGEAFDVLLLVEVVEHVEDVPAFVRDAVTHLAPGGLLLVIASFGKPGAAIARSQVTDSLGPFSKG